MKLDTPFMDTKGPLQLKPPAILAVATLERMFGVGPAEVFRSRRGVGYCPLAFKRRGTVVADGHFYGAAVRLMKRTHHSQSWSRLSEQNLRVDKWSVCRG